MADRQGNQPAWLAWALSALAGYVDALGVIQLGGYFASFMSGNSTLTAISLSQGQLGRALQGLAVIGVFVAGVTAGAWAVLRLGFVHRQRMLAAEAALLLLAALLASIGWNVPAMLLAIFAMGWENEVIRSAGVSGQPLTYMTGTLVKMAREIALALAGEGPAGAWLASLCLWLSFVAGAVIGALSHARLGLLGLWPAAICATLLSLGWWSCGRSRIPGP